MTTWTYIVESVPWIVVGVLVGFFMGRSTVVVDAIADAVQEEDDVDEVSKPRGWRAWVTSTNVIGVIVVVLGVFTAVQAYVQSDATARLTDCQAAYANGFADALDARAKATSDAQDALDELLTKVAGLSPTPQARDEFRDALDEYLDKRAAAKKAQQENPYPPAPRDVCKESR